MNTKFHCCISLLSKVIVITSGTWELVPHSKNSNRGHSLKRAESSSFSGHCLAYKYQVSLLYLIAKHSNRVITSGTWELVPHSKNSNRGHGLKKAHSSSFSAHCIAYKYQVSWLYLIAKHSY